MNRESWKLTVVALVVAVAAVWAHAPGLRGGVLTNMDDDVYLAAAEQYHGFTMAGVRWVFTETRPYYHPLPRLTYLVTYNLSGVQPVGHHAGNLLFHTINSVLVVMLAWRMWGGSVAGSGRVVATSLVGLVFVVHPLQAQSVAWIAGRTQLLCGMFMLGGGLAYLGPRADCPRGWVWVWVCFILGWLSKPIMVSLPLVLLVLDWWPLQRHVTLGWWRLVREKLWLFGVCLIAALVTAYSAQRAGMAPDTHQLELLQRFLVAERALVFYLWKLVWPAWLSPYYPLEGNIALTNPDFFVPLAILIIAGLGIGLARHRASAVAIGGLAYLALLLPVSGLTQFGSESVSNRHMYVAMLPLLFVLASGYVWLWQRISPVTCAALIVLTSLLLIHFGERTRAATQMWHDDETLWRNVLQWYPDCRFANSQVIEAEFRRRDYPDALVHATRLSELFPEDSFGHAAIGLAALKTGQYTTAVTQLRQAIALGTDLPATRFNLACAYARLGSNDAALATLEKLLPHEPKFLELAKRAHELYRF